MRRNAGRDRRLIKFPNGKVVVFIKGAYEITALACEKKKPQFSQRFTERRTTPSQRQSSKQRLCSRPVKMLVVMSKVRMFLTSPAWRNWQTRWTQNPVAARPCGFEPLRRQDRQVFGFLCEQTAPAHGLFSVSAC